MPFLDAKALENDPEGMAFLRAVIRPTFEQEEAASPPATRAEPKRLPASQEGEGAAGTAMAEAKVPAA